MEASALAHLADLVRVDLYISLELPPMAREVKAASDVVLARLVGLTYSLESSFGSGVSLLAGLSACGLLVLYSQKTQEERRMLRSSIAVEDVCAV